MTLALILAFAALGSDPTPIPVKFPTTFQEARPGYTASIEPILEARCVGCHNEANPGGKLSLESPAAMLRGGKRGPALVAKDADASLLFRLAAHRAEPVMPPPAKGDHPPLTPTELGLLKNWIDGGARDDSAALSRAISPIVLGNLPESIRSIGAVAVAADGKLVAAGRGNRVAVFEVGTGRILADLGGHIDLIQSLRFTPDGQHLAAGSYEVATLWDVPADLASPWPTPRTFGPHAFRVLAIDFSPDGRLMATGGGDPARSGEVKLWDLASGRLARSIDGLHTDTVCGLRFHPDGTKLATASADKFLKVVGLEDGKELKAFEGHTGHVLAVDWSADGKQIASGGADNVLKVWDLETGDLLRTLMGAGKPITGVRWVPNRPLVAGASGDGSVRYWNPNGAGNVVRTFAGPSDYLFGVATSRDGKLVAAGGADGILYLWNGDDGKLIRKVEPGPEAK